MRQAKVFFFVAAGILMLAVAFHLGAQTASGTFAGCIGDTYKCLELKPNDCIAIGGSPWNGPCGGSHCGACCLVGDNCIDRTPPFACVEQIGGTFAGDDALCSDDPCPATCLSDLNGDGFVATADLLTLLGDWGQCVP